MNKNSLLTLIDRLKGLKKYKRQISISLTLIILALFAYYFATNIKVFRIIKDFSIFDILVVVFFYGIFFILQAIILSILLTDFGRKLPITDGYAVNTYSSLVNLFGFFQGGIGIRAAYLKHKFKLNYKSFAKTLYIQYLLFFLASSIVMLLVFINRNSVVINWDIGILLGIAFGFIFATVLIFTKEGRRYLYGSKTYSLKRVTKVVFSISLINILQITVVGFIYWIQLINLDNSITYIQALGYSAIVNFSLLIALTPGAIGFREGLLEITQNVHGVSTELIIVNGLTDRFIYSLFLLLSFVMVLLFNRGLYQSLRS